MKKVDLFIYFYLFLFIEDNNTRDAHFTQLLFESPQASVIDQ